MNKVLKNVEILEKLGNGEQGNVYKAKYKNRTVVVKEFFIEDDEWELFEEPESKEALKKSIFIERKANIMTNDLVSRNICPHFPKHYMSVYHKTKRKAHAYHINEYIPNAITFDEWVQKKHDRDVWNNVYLQIMYSLYTLKQHYNLTHMDLHSENVLVQKLTKQQSWTYTIGNENYTVKSIGYKVYIIDFGHAWVPKQLRSWFIRERYRPCRVHSATDLTKLYRSCKSVSTMPKDLCKQLRHYINCIRTTGCFIDSLVSLVDSVVP